MGGILAGALALIALQVVVTSSANSASGTSTLASLAAYPGKLAAAWMDPARPLIPDKAGVTTTAAPAPAAPASPAPANPVATISQAYVT